MGIRRHKEKEQCNELSAAKQILIASFGNNRSHTVLYGLLHCDVSLPQLHSRVHPDQPIPKARNRPFQLSLHTQTVTPKGDAVP